MARYIWKDGAWIDRKTGLPMTVRPGPIAAPMVMRDIPEYASPVTGEMITSRSYRREDLRKHDCIEADPPKKKRGFVNPRFAKKMGVPVCEETKERIGTPKRIDPLADVRTR